MALDNRFLLDFRARGTARLLPSHQSQALVSKRLGGSPALPILAFLSNDNPWNAAEIVPNTFQVPGSVE
jgi:hypothetical protein